jgi:hypothetical protein
MKLRALKGSHAGQLYPVPDFGLTIGREADCQLVLDEAGISRHHARLTFQHGLYAIEDLGSTNGVRVNGERITGTRTLRNGDRIGVGDHLYLFTDEKDIQTPEELDRLTAPPAPAAMSRRTVLLVTLGSVAALLALAGLIWLLLPPAETPQTAGEPEPLALATPQAPRATRRPLPRPPATTTPTAGPPAVLYYRVDSLPQGAEVLVDGIRAGRTPQVVTNLAKGRHTVELSLTGYDPLTRFFFVPNPDSTGATFPLSQAAGSCVVTTDPPGAAVLRAGQLLGQTPLTITHLPPGEYPVRLVRPGCRPAAATLTVHQYRGSQSHTVLEPNLSTVQITTFPPEATVLVDKTPLGRSRARAQGPDSEPLALADLAEGRHFFALEYHGRTSEPVAVTLEAGKPTAVSLLLWLPNATVELTTGKTVKGMLRQETPQGDLELLVSATRTLTLKAAQVKKLTVIPFADVAVQPAAAEPAP